MILPLLLGFKMIEEHSIFLLIINLNIKINGFK